MNDATCHSHDGSPPHFLPGKGFVLFATAAAAALGLVVLTAAVRVALRKEQLGSALSTKDREKEQRRQAYFERGRRKSDLYDSIPLTRKGKVLSHISRKRARWYLRKELADEDEDGSIELRFEPKGEGTEHCKRQSRKPKKNECVACGDAKKVCRTFVVPRAYRKLLPRRFKSRSSHDVILLCMLHAEKWQKSQRKMQLALANEIGARIEEIGSTPAAFALKIARKQKARERRRMGMEIDSISPRLPQASFDSNWTFELRVLWHKCRRRERDEKGEFTYDEMQLQIFHERWRTFFLQEMQPGHMPEGFSITTPI